MKFLPSGLLNVNFDYKSKNQLKYAIVVLMRCVLNVALNVILNSASVIPSYKQHPSTLTNRFESDESCSVSANFPLQKYFSIFLQIDFPEL